MVETTEIFLSFHVSQMMAITGGSVETLEEIPAHVWKGLPDGLSLGPSEVNQSRVGESEGALVPFGCILALQLRARRFIIT